MLNETDEAASVMIAVGLPGHLSDFIEIMLVNDTGRWRIGDKRLLHESKSHPPTARFESPADFHLPPKQRALAFYDRYLPEVAEEQPYASERWASLMLDLRGWLTRPFMLRLLTEPHPDNGKNKDSLVCFAAVTERVNGMLAVPGGSFTVVDEQTRGDASSVTLEQRTSEGTVGTATLRFVKQDVWRLDKVTCPTK